MYNEGINIHSLCCMQNTELFVKAIHATGQHLWQKVK